LKGSAIKQGAYMNTTQSIDENQSSCDAFAKRDETEEEMRIRLKDEWLDKVLEGLDNPEALDSLLKVNPPPINEDSGIGSIVKTSPSTFNDDVVPAIKYEFPIHELGLYRDMEAGNILGELESMSQIAKKADQYLLVREEFCTLSIELNNRKLIAPAFRPSPTIPYLKKYRNNSHLLMQKDRIVIDCHWLHARKVKIYSSEPNWRGIFNLSKEFSFEKVSEFASHDIKNEYRATAIMKLTPHQQNQMRALRSVETQKRFQDLYESLRDGKRRLQPRLELIELAINQWCEADVRIVPHRPQYAALAMAIELTGDSSPTLLGELMGLILGTPPLAESTVRQKIINLRKAIDKYAIR
jgi:hypothetical protein